MLNALRNNLFRNFVECNAACLLIVQSEKFLQMPGNRLTFAVRVGGKINSTGLFAVCLQFLDQFLFFLHRNIFWLKAVLYIDTEFVLGKVPQMPH